jgi:hypothetical protein
MGRRERLSAAAEHIEEGEEGGRARCVRGMLGCWVKKGSVV